MIKYFILFFILSSKLVFGQEHHIHDINHRAKDIKKDYSRFGKPGTIIHEKAHGINSLITNKYRSSRKNYTLGGFYLLNNKEVCLSQPKTTMSRVANRIPLIARGKSYNLYLTNYDRAWENEPLFVVEEWVAYSNEIEACQGTDFLEPHSILLAHEFSIYAIPLLENADQDFVEFYKWNVERISPFLSQEAQEYKTVLYHKNCSHFLDILIKTYGQDWVKKHFHSKSDN